MKVQIHKHTTRSTGWLIYNKMQIFFKPFQPPTTATTGYNFTHPSDLNTCVSVFIGFSYHDVHGFLPERVDENQQDFEGGPRLCSPGIEDDDEDIYSDETDDEEFYTREKEKEEEREKERERKKELEEKEIEEQRREEAEGWQRVKKKKEKKNVAEAEVPQSQDNQAVKENKMKVKKRKGAKRGGTGGSSIGLQVSSQGSKSATAKRRDRRKKKKHRGNL